MTHEVHLPLTAPAPRLSSAELARRSLAQVARDSLAANLERVGERTLLTAGRRHFRSLWTRDFCMSVPGLLELGRADVVRDQLTLVLEHLRDSDAQAPRTLDSMDPKRRIVLETLGRLFPLFARDRPLTPALRAEHEDQHGIAPIDGNALIVVAAAQYMRATGDHAWLERHRGPLQKALAYYDGRLLGGLVHQPPFSDWQDSVRREGATAFVNLAYWSALRAAAELGLGDRRLLGERSGALAERIEATFFDAATGLYRSVRGQPHISLDANLMVLGTSFVPRTSARGRALYAALKAHALWRAAGGVPGVATLPDYPRAWRNLTVRLVGLDHYHDRLSWSWLTAHAAKVAALMDDREEAERIVTRLGELAVRDRVISEVHEPSPAAPAFANMLYRSEAPFAWGAAATLEASVALERLKR